MTFEMYFQAMGNDRDLIPFSPLYIQVDDGVLSVEAQFQYAADSGFDQLNRFMEEGLIHSYIVQGCVPSA